MYPPCAYDAGRGGIGGGVGARGGGWGKGRWKLFADEEGENEYARGPENCLAYLFQHLVHGRAGSASL